MTKKDKYEVVYAKTDLRKDKSPNNRQSTLNLKKNTKEPYKPSGIKAKTKLPLGIGHGRKDEISRDNPYMGNTPVVPQKIVKPDAKGVYGFSPNAAAFKWNWNLLDVRGKSNQTSPLKMVADTPAGAFKAFQKDFDVTPIIKGDSVFDFKRPSETGSQSPLFPSHARAAKRVNVDNLVYTPGGLHEGRQIEFFWKKQKDLQNEAERQSESFWSDRSKADRKTERRAEKALRVPGPPKPRKYSPSKESKRADEGMVKTRGQNGRSSQFGSSVIHSSRTRPVTYVDDGGGYYLYKVKLYNDRTYATDIPIIWAHGIMTLMYIGAVFLVTPVPDSPLVPVHVVHMIKDSQKMVERALQSEDDYTYTSYIAIAVIWCLFVCFEVFRGLYLFSRRKKKFVRNSYFGNLIKSCMLGCSSSINTTAVISGVSLLLSASLCGLFILYHKGDEGWSETKSLFWSIGLIHSGIVSNTLTRQILYHVFPSTRIVALEDPGYMRVCFTVSTIIPTLVGWVVMHVWVLRYLPLNTQYISIWDKLFKFITRNGYTYTLIWWAFTGAATIGLFDLVDLSVKLSSDLYTGNIDYQLMVADPQKQGRHGESPMKKFKEIVKNIWEHSSVVGVDFWQIPVVLLQHCI